MHLISSETTFAASPEVVFDHFADHQKFAKIFGGTCTRVQEGEDYVACVGENRKVLIFPLDELPEMGRGKGVRLQKFKDGGLADAKFITLSVGLSWQDPAGRTRTETDLAEWIGKRAGSGRMAPRGFPRDNRFN